MKPGTKAILLVYGVVVVGLFLVGFLKLRESREPVYLGNVVSYWANQLRGQGTVSKFLSASSAIRQIGPPGIPFVMQAVRRDHSAYRRWHRAIWPKLPTTVRSKLPEPRGRIRLEFIGSALGSFGSPAFPKLVPSLEDPDEDVRFVAIMAIESSLRTAVLDQETDAIVPVLLKLVKDSSVSVRFHAVLALGLLGPNRKPAIPALTSALRDSGIGWIDRQVFPGTYQLEIRHEAARILGEIGPEAKMAVPGLKALLQDSNLAARIEATIALWHVNADTNVIPLLISELKQTPNAATCRRIVTVFGEMGGAAKAAIPAMVEKVAHPPIEPMIPATSLRDVAMDAVDKIDFNQWKLLLPPSAGRKHFFDYLEKPPIQALELQGNP